MTQALSVSTGGEFRSERLFVAFYTGGVARLTRWAHMGGVWFARRDPEIGSSNLPPATIVELRLLLVCVCDVFLGVG